MTHSQATAPPPPLLHTSSSSSPPASFATTMRAPDSAWFSRVSQRKLLSSFAAGARDNLSLHRWVVLKNFVTRTDPPAPADGAYAYPSAPEDEPFVFPDEDVFVFPSATSLEAPDAASAEARWLDALLEELDDTGTDPGDASPAPILFAPLGQSAPPSSSTITSRRAGAPGSIPLPPPLCIVPVPDLPPTPAPSPSPSIENDYPFPFSHFDDDDQSSDDDSDGPETPLAMSTLDSGLAPSAVAVSGAEAYFVYPLEPAPISPLQNSLIYMQEC